MNKVAIVIHAYQHPADLDQCLKNISYSKYLNNSDILVVDNSFDQKIQEENRKVIALYADNRKIEYLDQAKWHDFVERGPFSDPEKEMMQIISLGKRDWSTHNARNVGMLYSRHLFSETDFTFNLDQDIIVPASADLRHLNFGILGCASISGCPDLSRLEWIGFYHLYLSNILKVEIIRSSQDYAQRMISENSFETVQDILVKYTDFPTSSQEDAEDIDIPNFIQREEFYGACFFSRLANTSLLVPEWYDNDWFFFRHTRKNKNVVEFQPLTVHHASIRKSINNEYGYQVEEYGKVVNDVYDIIDEQGLCGIDSFQAIISKRHKIIDEELKQNEILQNCGNNGPYIKTLDDIRTHMILLRKKVSEYDLSTILSDILNYKSQASLWRSASERLPLRADKICQKA